MKYESLMNYKFCTQNPKKSQDDINADIMAKRKAQEQLEIKNLKKEIDMPTATFSLIPDFLKITRPWILGVLLVFATIYIIKKLFVLTEVMIDPVSGQKKRQLFGPSAGII